jgi:hypothetical protein
MVNHCALAEAVMLALLLTFLRKAVAFSFLRFLLSRIRAGENHHSREIFRILFRIWGGLGDGRVVACLRPVLERRRSGAQFRFLRTSPMPTHRPLPVLRPDRVRQIPRSFAWLDHRLRSDSILAALTPEEIGLYCFLSLAADAQGLSCWRLDRIERALPIDTARLRRARDGLIRADLLAFRSWNPSSPDGSYQLLSVPPAAPQVPRGRGASIGEILAGLGCSRR